MRTHAVFLRLEGRTCVVVGGDQIAADKTALCLGARAHVTVVAPDLLPALGRLRDEGRIAHHARAYRDGDLRGAFLAYASEHDPGVIAVLRAEAERERVLLNVADEVEGCTFFAPALVARGDLQIAIGTGGASPGLAAGLRRDLESRFGPEYAPYVAILGAVRRSLARAQRGEVMGRLVDSDLLALVRRGERGEIGALLQRLAGEGCTLGRLGVALDGEG